MVGLLASQDFVLGYFRALPTGRIGAEGLNRSSIMDGRVEQLLEAIEVLPLEAKTDVHYGRIRAQLEKTGTPIGGNDPLIAANALAIDAVLVTDNVREFKRVKELRIENWLRS